MTTHSTNQEVGKKAGNRNEHEKEPEIWRVRGNREEMHSLANVVRVLDAVDGNEVEPKHHRTPDEVVVDPSPRLNDARKLQGHRENDARVRRHPSKNPPEVIF